MLDKIKEAWLLALRSGTFKQGRHKLFEPETDSYCCLGVLCKVLGAEFQPFVTDEGWEYNDVPVTAENHLLSPGEDACLSKDTLEELGLDEEIQNDLIKLNDGNTLGRRTEPQSFLQIADYIEDEL